MESLRTGRFKPVGGFGAQPVPQGHQAPGWHETVRSAGRGRLDTAGCEPVPHGI